MLGVVMAKLPENAIDRRRCFACSKELPHSLEQHEEYLAIWCEAHNFWCGNHTHKSIKEAIDTLREKRKRE
jgi:hypothetical protein